MIMVTGLNKLRWAVNPDLIERMHESPDTTLVMIDGATHNVQERMADLIDTIAAYRARVIAMARDIPMATTQSGAPILKVVTQQENHTRHP